MPTRGLWPLKPSPGPEGVPVAQVGAPGVGRQGGRECLADAIPVGGGQPRRQGFAAGDLASVRHNPMSSALSRNFRKKWWKLRKNRHQGPDPGPERVARPARPPIGRSGEPLDLIILCAINGVIGRNMLLREAASSGQEKG